MSQVDSRLLLKFAISGSPLGKALPYDRTTSSGWGGDRFEYNYIPGAPRPRPMLAMGGPAMFGSLLPVGANVLEPTVSPARAGQMQTQAMAASAAAANSEAPPRKFERIADGEGAEWWMGHGSAKSDYWAGAISTTSTTSKTCDSTSISSASRSGQAVAGSSTIQGTAAWCCGCSFSQNSSTW